MRVCVCVVTAAVVWCCGAGNTGGPPTPSSKDRKRDGWKGNDDPSFHKIEKKACIFDPSPTEDLGSRMQRH